MICSASSDAVIRADKKRRIITYENMGARSRAENNPSALNQRCAAYGGNALACAAVLEFDVLICETNTRTTTTQAITGRNRNYRAGRAAGIAVDNDIRLTTTNPGLRYRRARERAVVELDGGLETGEIDVVCDIIEGMLNGLPGCAAGAGRAVATTRRDVIGGVARQNCAARSTRRQLGKLPIDERGAGV